MRLFYRLLLLADTTPFVVPGSDRFRQAITPVPGPWAAMEHNPELWITFHCSQNPYWPSLAAQASGSPSQPTQARRSSSPRMRSGYFESIRRRRPADKEPTGRNRPRLPDLICSISLGLQASFIPSGVSVDHRGRLPYPYPSSSGTYPFPPSRSPTSSSASARALCSNSAFCSSQQNADVRSPRLCGAVNGISGRTVHQRRESAGAA